MSNLQAAQLLSAGQQYLKLGQTAKAIEIFQRAIAADSNSFLAQSLLAAAYQKAGKIPQAIAHLQIALTLNPDWAQGHAVLGTLWAAQGNFQLSAASFASVIHLQPSNVEAINNLGTVLKSLGRYDEAITHLRRAAALMPDKAEIHNNLGNALLESGQTLEAVTELKMAVALKPDYVQLYQALGSALIAAGMIDEAIDIFRRALQIDPTHHQIHSSLLMSLHYTDQANENPQSLFQEHQNYGRLQSSRVSHSAAHTSEHDLTRLLRIGYFSPDFRRHSVSYFIEPLLAHHDASKVEIYCYADVATPDEVTNRLRQYVRNWRTSYGWDNPTLAAQIQQDQIDILIDLSGHTGGGRLPLFARKPAPVQVSYLGYPNTTGLSAVDYRIVDDITDPPGESDLLHAERLIRLPVPFLCYAPPSDAPPVSVLPALSNGYITFGSFNTLAKLTRSTLKLWSDILHAVHDSHLLIKARGLQQPAAADRLANVFLSHGIQRNRLTFLGHQDTTLSHLACYHRIDIALDPFPYNGTTTTCEALWMGVPVLTRAGNIHAARVGASLLTSLHKTQWIAQSHEKMIRVASDLANHIDALDHERQTLREHIKTSPLTNAPNFARKFEAALEKRWQEMKK